MKTTKFFLLNTLCCSFLFNASAAEVEMNTARMQAMDKITGHVNVINVPVNGTVDFGSLSILVRSCKSRPVEEAPENFAFVDITDKSLKGDELNIFKGWMLSSSPATNAVEHPIYDVWLLQCLNTRIDDKKLLSSEQLAARDNLPQTNQLTFTDAKSTNIEKSSKSRETISSDKKTMSELEYIQDENSPNHSAKEQTGSTNPEFSFDEEDDTTEIQNELEQLKEKLEKETSNSLE